MTFIKIIIYFFLFFLSFEVHSITLIDKLSNFLKKEFVLNKNDTQIILHSSLKKNICCQNPLFSLSNKLYYSRIINILLICGQKKQYLTVELQIKGKYIVANKKIPRGTKIQESDLTVIKGRLDMIPKNTYLHKKDVINRISLRDIYPLQPITSFMTRPFWLVKINQKVTFIVNGTDFKIISKGKSLINATINQIIRIKTNTGKILTGVLNKYGEVIVDV